MSAPDTLTLASLRTTDFAPGQLGVLGDPIAHSLSPAMHNAALATLLPILALFFFGGETLQDFAFALIVGIAIGAYSSFFVASPLLSVLKSREPEYRGRPGSTELPAFMLGKAGAEQQKVAVAAGVDATLVVEAEEILDAPSDAPAAPTADAPPTSGTAAGPDDAAIEAARRRRANRRDKKR
jgi:hypothetical protein